MILDDRTTVANITFTIYYTPALENAAAASGGTVSDIVDGILERANIMFRCRN